MPYRATPIRPRATVVYAEPWSRFELGFAALVLAVFSVAPLVLAASHVDVDCTRASTPPRCTFQRRAVLYDKTTHATVAEVATADVARDDDGAAGLVVGNGRYVLPNESAYADDKSALAAKLRAFAADEGAATMHASYGEWAAPPAEAIQFSIFGLVFALVAFPRPVRIRAVVDAEAGLLTVVRRRFPLPGRVERFSLADVERTEAVVVDDEAASVAAVSPAGAFTTIASGLGRGRADTFAEELNDALAAARDGIHTP